MRDRRWTSIKRSAPLWAVLVGLLGGLGLITACGDGEPTGPVENPAAIRDLRIEAGNNQTGKPGEALAGPFTVKAVNGVGRPVAGVAVRFLVADGGGMLVQETDIPATVKVALTGDDGMASVTLILGTAPGVNQVTASVAGLAGLPPVFTAAAEGDGVEGGGSGLPGRNPDADHFSLSVELLNLPGGVVFGLQDLVTAFVFDANSNPVSPGTVVRFRTTGGGIAETARTDASGQASAHLFTAEPIPDDGWVTVTAEVIGAAEQTLSTDIRLLFSGPTQVRLIQPASFAVAAGETKAFVVYVGDANGHPLAGGSRIEVSAEGGEILGSSAFYVPDTQRQEETLFSVLYQADEAGPTPQMVVDVTSPNGNRAVTLVSGVEGDEGSEVGRVATSIAVVAQDSVLIADGISETTVRATVVDSAGNGVPNQVVQFVASAGSIDRTSLTDAAGQAEVSYRSAANPEGVPAVTLEALIGNLSSVTQLRLLGLRLQLSPATRTIAADGIQQTTVTATLTTEEGEPVPFVPVDFAATLGRLSADRVTTDVNGRATVIYTGVASPEDLAGAQVRARASRIDATADLEVLGVRVELSASPDTIIADGNAQASIVARVRRTDGMPIINGAARFETTLGGLSSEVVRTGPDGTASTILVAGTEAGKATVKVSYGEGLEDYTEVALVKGLPASIVLVSVDPPAIGVRGAGANETAIVLLEVRDARGNTVADGATVRFRLDAPGGYGERVGPDSTATVGGRVQAAVTSGTLARTVRLIAEVSLPTGDVIRATPVPIAIHASLPDLDHFSLSANPVNLAGRVLLGLESEIVTYVFDKYSNPVSPGTSIRFRTNGGGVQGAAETNADGQATVRLFTAAPVPPGPAYLATVTGQTVDENGREIEAATTVLFSGPTAPIRLTGAGADTIGSGHLFVADGSHQIITFRVSDISNKPLMGGSEIQAFTDVGVISGDTGVILPDVREGHIDYAIVVADAAPGETPPKPPQSGSVLIKVISPNGNQQLSFGVSVD